MDFFILWKLKDESVHRFMLKVGAFRLRLGFGGLFVVEILFVGKFVLVIYFGSAQMSAFMGLETNPGDLLLERGYLVEDRGQGGDCVHSLLLLRSYF